MARSHFGLGYLLAACMATMGTMAAFSYAGTLDRDDGGTAVLVSPSPVSTTASSSDIEARYIIQYAIETPLVSLCKKCGPKVEDAHAGDYLRANQPGAAWRIAASTTPPPLARSTA